MDLSIVYLTLVLWLLKQICIIVYSLLDHVTLHVLQFLIPSDLHRLLDKTINRYPFPIVTDCSPGMNP